MAKKRLTCDIEEDLHSSLKERAAAERVPLGTLCSSLLSIALNNKTIEPTPPHIELYSSMPLNELRNEVMRLGIEKPSGWEMAVRRANSEIVKRYKIK